MHEKRIGGGDGSAAAFNEDHPLFRAIREMIAVRKQNPTLQRGIQIVRYADEKPGIFAISRIDRERREEMLAVFNNSSDSKKANIRVYSIGGQLGTGLRFRRQRDQLRSRAPTTS